MANKELINSLKNVIATSKELENKALYLISNIIYALESDTALYGLAKILSEDQLVQMMKSKGGETVKIPTHEEYVEKKKLAIIYYMKTVKEMEWSEIFEEFKKTGFPLEENAIKIAKRLSKVDDYMERVLKDLTN